MDYSDLEEEVVARLDSLNTSDCKVLAQPENQQDFKRTVEKARITVAYIGSKGDKITATDLVRQSENVCVEVVIQARKLRGVGYSVLKLIASVKALLIGWKATNCNRMYFDDAGIVDYVEGVFTYSIKFKCESEIWQLEEEQIAPLIKSITVGDTVTNIPVPKNLSVQVIEGIAILSWDAMEGVDSYIVYVDGEFLTNIDITQLSYGSIVNGNSYTFEVFSVKNGKVGESSSVVLDYVAEVTPDKVTGLSTLSLLSNLHKFSWDEVVGVDISYNIYRNDVLIANTTNAFYTDFPLSSSSDYSYTVSALSGVLEGEESDALEVTTGFVYFQTLFPTNLIYAFSLRKINMAYTGNCLRLYRHSDGAEMDFGFNDDDTYLDLDAVTTWLGGETGYVTTWYNQSNSDGDGASTFESDMTQTNYLYMPVLVHLAAKTSYIDFSGSKMKYLDSALTAYNQPNTSLSVFKMNSSGLMDTEYQGIFTGSNNRQNDLLIDRDGGTGEFYMTAADFNSGLASGISKNTDEHVIAGIFDTPNCKFYLDGSLVASGNSGTDQLRNPRIGNLYTGTHGLTGYVKECIYFNTGKNDDIVSMQEQMIEYYGIL